MGEDESAEEFEEEKLMVLDIICSDSGYSEGYVNATLV